MDYYSRATLRAEILAHLNAQDVLLAQQVRQAREAQEWAAMRRDARKGWYSLSREQRLYWESVVPGVSEVVKEGDYITAIDLIAASPQFKQMQSGQKKK
jgi:hypothetical protein